MLIRVQEPPTQIVVMVVIWNKWINLLSFSASLGGVFNMFLGVGLFSALEFLFFLFVKLPIAVRESTEMTPVVFNRVDQVS